MRIRSAVVRTAVLFLSLTLASCGGCSLPGLRRGTVTLVSYNVENLFDDVHNGGEYREYDPAEGEWTTELFHLKMQHLAEVLRGAVRGGADIVALEEVENAHAVDTLNETYLKGLGYRALTAEAGRTEVSVALLSRLPVEAIRMHHLVAAGAEPQRDIMEVHLDCRGEGLVVFVNHWKSKLAGAEATEPERRAAAGRVARRICALAVEEPASAVVVAGDLNESWDEYSRVEARYATALLPDSAGPAGEAAADNLFVTASPAAARLADKRVVLYSPWAEGETGSYVYAGRWETIDHTLLGPGLFDGKGLEYRSFAVFDPDYLLGKGGVPLGWNSARGSGYSDHLPIVLTLEVVS